MSVDVDEHCEWLTALRYAKCAVAQTSVATQHMRSLGRETLLVLALPIPSEGDERSCDKQEYADHTSDNDGKDKFRGQLFGACEDRLVG